MSFQTRHELLARVVPRYREADRKQKTIILNEFIASTGYKRKYAIRLLSLPKIAPGKTIKRPRSRYYGQEVQEALLVAWAAANSEIPRARRVLARFYSYMNTLLSSSFLIYYECFLQWSYFPYSLLKFNGS